MVFDSYFARLLQSMHDTLYRGRVKKILQNTILGTLFGQLYWFLLLSSISRKSCTINETEACFAIDSKREFERITDLADEEPVLVDVVSNVREDDVFWDVGANIGLYTCLIGNKLESGQVIAFEPFPKNAEKLNENMKLNDVNGEVSPYALADSEGTGKLSISGEQVGVGKASLIDDSKSSRSTTEVQTVAGDTLVEDHDVPAPTILKIDVEGAEVGVLKGLQNTIAQPECRIIYCEIHHDLIEDGGFERIWEMLEESEFEPSTIHARGSTTFIKGKRK